MEWCRRATWAFCSNPKEKHIFLVDCNYLKTMSKQKSYFFSLETFIFPFYVSVCLLICLPFYLSVFFISAYMSPPPPVHQHFLFSVVRNSPQRSGSDGGAASGRAVSAPQSAARSQVLAPPAPSFHTFALPHLNSAWRRPQLFKLLPGRPGQVAQLVGALS